MDLEYAVIVSFANKRAAVFHLGQRVAAFSGFARTASRKLDQLDAATGLRDLERSGNRLKALKGRRNGQWSDGLRSLWSNSLTSNTNWTSITKSLLPTVLIGLLTMLPGMTVAQDVNYAALFNRCGLVDLVVAGTEDAESLNIVGRAETMAESRMRAARIYGDFIYPELFIFIDVDLGSEMTIYMLSLDFRKVLTDSYGAEMPGTVVGYGFYGAATNTDSGEVADDIINSVSEYLDRFILEYLRANEGYCE